MQQAPSEMTLSLPSNLLLIAKNRVTSLDPSRPYLAWQSQPHPSLQTKGVSLAFFHKKHHPLQAWNPKIFPAVALATPVRQLTRPLSPNLRQASTLRQRVKEDQVEALVEQA